MKATKILVMLLALVLVFALVACGGEKEPEVTEDATATTTTAAAATTTKAAATTTKAAATTTKAAATTTAAPVVTTTAAPVAVEFPNTIEEYKSLYVADGNVVHLNFAEATVDSPAIVGSSKYEDETTLATNRFNGAASNYTDYLFNSTLENPISGGTAKILTPWIFENYYVDGYWSFEGGAANSASGKVADMRVIEPEEYVKTVDQSGQTVYVKYTQVEDTEFYMQNGTWAKKTYASTWGNGYLTLGLNSTLSLSSSINAALGDDRAYTVQLVFKREGTGGLNPFLGARFSISESNGNVRVSGNAGNYNGVIEAIEVAGDLDIINGYTFAIDKDAAENDFITYFNATQTASLTIGYPKDDGTLKVFEGANSSVYAIRVYDDILTAEEVAQNHFADLALICRLDITEFLKLDDAARASVYNALAEYTYDIPQMLLQKALNDAIAAAK